MSKGASGIREGLLPDFGGRLQGWLHKSDRPWMWRLGNGLSDLRYWWWHLGGGGWNTTRGACGAWIMHEGPCALHEGHDGPHDIPVVGKGAKTAYERLRAWSRDAVHLVQSVRMHEPIYANPSELRADVRALLDEHDDLVGELVWHRDALEPPV